MTVWTPVGQQSETWTSLADGTRVFDPAVFDNAPIFDTGQAGGFWAAKAEQVEPWIDA